MKKIIFAVSGFLFNTEGALTLVLKNIFGFNQHAMNVTSGF